MPTILDLSDPWDHPRHPEFWESLPYRPTPSWLLQSWERSENRYKPGIEYGEVGCWVVARLPSRGKTWRSHPQGHYPRHGKVKLWWVIWRELVGAVPQARELDHLCHIRSCVNPFHLEPVTLTQHYARSALWKEWCKWDSCLDRMIYPQAIENRRERMSELVVIHQHKL